jgi:hypothetical protein
MVSEIHGRGAYPLIALFLMFCLAPAFAGQSIVLANATASNASIPAQSLNGACRLEISFHDWDSNPPIITHPWYAAMCGIITNLSNLGDGDLRLIIYSVQGTGGQVCTIPLGTLNGKPVLPSKFVTIRFQRKPALPIDISQTVVTGGVEDCEATDIDGNTFWTESHAYTGVSGALTSGVTVGDLTWKVDVAYFRLFTTTVALGSRPPVTADKGDLLEWKFDGDLKDSSGHGYDAILSSGAPAFLPTPGQNLVVAAINTAGAPAWSPWTSLRVGYPNQLDCSNSYSQADTSAQVSCSWAVPQAPSTPSWSSQSVKQPTLSSIAFGTYNFQLTITDVNGQTATKNLAVGAVAYDDNGVVIPSNPQVTDIFGPMIAFGQNPWGWMDQRAYAAIALQTNYIKTVYPTPPTWTTSGSGTISYPFAGKGPFPGPSCTTLSADVTASDTNIPVKDAACLSLGSLPTWILIGNSIGQQEMVRICSTTGTSGAQTLTACYDGRGVASYGFARSGVGLQTLSARSWPDGTIVGEYRIQGTGTQFATDANRPICAAGVPGPPGPVVYSTGTVTLAPSSTIVIGNGTTWNRSSGLIVGGMIRVAATHGGGNPFIWWAMISTIGDTTTITASRPAPTDVDAGPFPYKITGQRYYSLDVTVPTDGNTVHILNNVLGCESETAAFGSAALDIPAFDHTTQSGVHYSYKDVLNASGPSNFNFYGTGLAARAFYLRSGYEPALAQANSIDEYWVLDPEICSGWCGGFTPGMGGGAIGAMADLATNPSTALTWLDVKQFGVRASSVGASGCNDYDTRDSGIFEGWTSLLALLDPDATRHTAWNNSLYYSDSSFYQRDLNCSQPDYSFKTGFYFNPSGPIVDVTNGSAVVTAHSGSTFSPGNCWGQASGTATINTNSDALTAATGSFLKGSYQIVVTGLLEGKTYSLWTNYQVNSPNSATLAALWPGSSGTVRWTIIGFDSSYVAWDQLVLATSANDADGMGQNFVCTYNSPTQITLNREWPLPTDTSGTRVLYSANFAGTGQQPFMLGGYKSLALQWAALSTDSAIASSFTTILQGVSQWLHDNFNLDDLSPAAGRVFQACEPTVAASPNYAGPWKASTCQQGSDPDSIVAGRELIAESSTAFRAYFTLNNSSDAARKFGDQAYGGLWSSSAYDESVPYWDLASAGNNSGRSNLGDAYLSSYKWPGFFFGIGMAHQWPAVRTRGLNNLSPLRLRRWKPL